jgi:uncharacterized protein YndB with AHSA1/START domain
MAYIFKRSIIIGVPPEQVYDELVDIASHKEWGEMSELELLFEGPAQIGSRWRSSGTTSNFVMQDECTITEMERPHQFSFRVKSQSQMGTGHIILTYRLEPAPEGTLVTWSRENLPNQELSPIMKFIIAIPGVPQLMDRLVTSTAVDRGLDNLRERLESKSV